MTGGSAQGISLFHQYICKTNDDRSALVACFGRKFPPWPADDCPGSMTHAVSPISLGRLYILDRETNSNLYLAMMTLRRATPGSCMQDLAARTIRLRESDRYRAITRSTGVRISHA
jgi:hypothetical protein